MVDDALTTGYLSKWTNYVRGYQSRYFVISNGFLSYYRSSSDVDDGVCRGTMCLSSATVNLNNSRSFYVSNGQMSYHLKANTSEDRDQWIKAIRTEADKYYQVNSQERKSVEVTLQKLAKKFDQLLKFTTAVKVKTTSFLNEVNAVNKMDLPPKLKVKLSTLFEFSKDLGDTYSSICVLAEEILTLSQEVNTKLLSANENSKYLEDMIEVLGQQHRNLERKFQDTMTRIKRLKGGGGINYDQDLDEEEEEEFFDALSEETTQQLIRMPSLKKLQSVKEDTVSQDVLISRLQSPGSEDDESNPCIACVFSRKPKKTASAVALALKKSFSYTRNRGAGKSRTPKYSSRKACKLPPHRVSIVNRMHHRDSPGPASFNRRLMIPPPTSASANLWAVLKSFAGKDLSRASLPVCFNEPLTFLQRLTEELEYSNYLDMAAGCESSLEQMSYVAAFSVSSYSETAFRTTKPFNPLLGETFECDRRDDYGWRSFSEQVSHHPPTAAMHVDGIDWSFWQEFTMVSKFRGHYIQVNPLGYCHLLFPKSGNHYTWQKVETTVHNVIVGQVWLDHHGEYVITNHRTGETCQLVFATYSLIYRDGNRKVTGIISDPQNEVKFVIQGTWDDLLERCRVLSMSNSTKGKVSFNTDEPVVIWTRMDPPLNSSYNFSRLAVQLNEPEPNVAPTDSRLRPDLRLMEQGNMTEADTVKVLLEEKQRSTRRRRQSSAASKGIGAEEADALLYEPKWFKRQDDPLTGYSIYRFTNEYWACKKKQDWSRCPNIFL